jgi:hypothetical protein
VGSGARDNECAERDARRLPSDEDRWKAYLTDRYRHLREGHEARAAELRRLLDACHEQQPIA